MAGFLLIWILVYHLPLATPELPTLILSEMCYYPINFDYLQLQLGNNSYKMATSEDICSEHQRILEIISSSKEYVLGSLKPSLCSSAYLMAKFHNVTLVTWNCPQNTKDDDEADAYRVSPSVTYIAETFAQSVAQMKWRSIAIISSGMGWWPNLSQLLDVHLREIGIISRHYFIIPETMTAHEIQQKIRILKRNPCRAVIVCAPVNEVGRTILTVIDHLNLARDHNTLTIFVDISSLPSWMSSLGDEMNVANSTGEFQNLNLTRTEIDLTTKRFLLVFSENVFGNISSNFVYNISVESVLVRRIKHATSVLKGRRMENAKFVLLDLRDEGTWRPLLISGSNSDNELVVNKILDNLEEWTLKHKDNDECEGCESELKHLISVLIIFGCSFTFVLILMVFAALIRKQFLKKKLSKGPYKVLLTASDFVFPQIPDSRRLSKMCSVQVDEGIEAMLCCWLQQLQEFGGPEVDKPDLLQGSGGSIRTPHRVGSSPNLAKQLIVDPRVRYNGDLVQMKPLPPSTIELKAKAVEVLVMLHGLRHENLNPLIGCLAEPPRAALVAEWCSRGSLQDVLQQDEIKLDWSFRLSLLTDLVRGMKYLHSTPVRVHGYLTSRNCVIDARWVLKITDYGLPTFYEGQGITPPQKSARDLLWSAPELLRHVNLRKKGTQPGDVYSFGIICQEVVVRGEPFCMFALTPEEIIEKVKRPPPLIRPSVSKGAAPPEAINIMRQCWAEQPDLRPDFNAVHDLFKKLNHGRKVNIVDTMFQMLEKYSNNLEELIRERTEQLDIEKKKTEQLLNRMLPSSVADKLKLGMPVDPEEFEEVTIYFSDIVGFTTISAHSTPFQVVDLLNDLYTCFDATINAYNVYKIETIGDAYMVVGGLPVRVPDHAEQVATMALDLLHQSGRFRIRHLPGTPLRLRIGLHSGPCCSGVVGLTMPRYCLFGDTVNTASRMESTGAAWRIHLSEATKERLERAGGYQLEYRGATEIKGKGKMPTYWLLGKAGFVKVLPTPPSIELDESLIVCKLNHVSNNIQVEEMLQPIPEVSRILHEDHPVVEVSKPLHLDNTFMQKMEHSKFSSLMKNTDAATQRADFHMVKSTSSETPMSLGTPVSATEVAAALLAVSTNSLGGFRGRHRPGRLHEDDDLSTPYNQYKCLSPKERAGKLLRRQFSLDKTEEVSNEFLHSPTPRLCKQSSLGVADLEKIEEASGVITPTTSPYQCTLSISVDSLIR
ncbi:retinal guanylyl cyclase 2 isoform X2 [Photinus pyralis]|uniref:retinal guanylyl cyclase 2 isoform X2 n=1 Tax=Photinus pyralis TaxID=7054 RepID=UPI001266E6AA|nr:retinal guanylyl cyclase 2 isoform X2 [Photinus pyralis]